MSSNPVGISIQDLQLAFGEHQVLKGIDLEIEPGELFAFLGPSGSGKSTLLRAIAGFGPKPRGRILIGGQEVGGLPPWQRNVGMVFQSFNLFPHMTVVDNLTIGPMRNKGLSRDEARETALHYSSGCTSPSRP